MLPASLAAEVPVFIATPTSAWASAGASLVPSPVIATSLPPSCSARMRRHLVLGGGLGEEVVDAGLLGDGLGGQGVVAGDHHGADPHRPQLVEALAHAGLDDVLEVDDAERAGRPPAFGVATTRGVAPSALMPSTSVVQVVRRRVPPDSSTHAVTAEPAPLRTLVPSGRSTPDIRVWARELHELGTGRRSSANEPVAGSTPAASGQVDDRASLGGLVGERGEVGRAQPGRAGRLPATGTTSLAAGCRR